RQFNHDHRVGQCLIRQDQIDQCVIAVPKMIYPYGSVDEYAHFAWGSVRRRGTSCMSGAVPPRAARRLAACTRTKVLIASRKRSDLSMLGSATSSACS